MEGLTLSEAQVALVLRRAAELDRTDDDAPHLDAAAVAAAAVEAGLSPQSVCQALAELRVGSLEPAGGERSGLFLGPPNLIVRRVVPGPLLRVEREVAAYLTGQLFERRRHLGDRTLWERRDGLLPSLRRSLDLNHRLSLNGVRRLEVALAEEPAANPRRVVVRVDADVREPRNAHAWLLGGGTATGAGLVGAAAVADLLVLMAAALPLGVGVAAGGHWAGRGHYRREVAKIETALAGLLDRLEHESLAPDPFSRGEGGSARPGPRAPGAPPAPAPR